MSRDPDEAVPPRRPKPSTKKKVPPDDPVGDEPSTFRPSPKRSDARSSDDPANTFRRTKKSTSKLAAGRPLDEPDKFARGPSWSERILFGSVGTANLAQFCRQFGAYLDAGVDLLKALSSLEKQFKSKALGPVIGRLRQSVRKGDPLADAAEREPRAFDRL